MKFFAKIGAFIRFVTIISLSHLTKGQAEICCPCNVFAWLGYSFPLELPATDGNGNVTQFTR